MLFWRIDRFSYTDWLDKSKTIFRIDRYKDLEAEKREPEKFSAKFLVRTKTIVSGTSTRPQCDVFFFQGTLKRRKPRQANISKWTSLKYVYLKGTQCIVILINCHTVYIKVLLYYFRMVSNGIQLLLFTTLLLVLRHKRIFFSGTLIF